MTRLEDFREVATLGTYWTWVRERWWDHFTKPVFIDGWHALKDLCIVLVQCVFMPIRLVIQLIHLPCEFLMRCFLWCYFKVKRR